LSGRLPGLLQRGRLLRPAPEPLAAMSGEPPATPSRAVSEETLERLRRNVLRLTAALGSAPGGRMDGITSASVQMLSKMISRYDVTKARSPQATNPFPPTLLH